MTDDLRFDELLREDAAALPPPADGEITPWRTAMDRILWGMGLTTITLNFLWLDVLLPAIGAVLLVLGFRTLRRENAPLRWGYRLALLALAIRFAGDVLAALPVDVGNAPAYVHIPVTLALYVCLWRGMVGVSRAAGAEKPAAPAAGAMAVFYAALTALALIGLEGWLLVLPLLALYLFLLRSMVRLSRSLTDTGYAITAAPVRLSDSAVLWSALGALLALKKKGFKIPTSAVRAGLADVHWPGRLEYFGRVLLDGAHNDPGVRALCGYLDRWMPKENTVLISAMMRDKETEKMCQRLAARVRCVVCTQPNIPRAMPAGELAKEFEAQGIRAYAFAHVKDALEEARRLAGPEGNVVCAGSLYLIGEMRTVLREERDKR